jgi:hypothetical protein
MNWSYPDGSRTAPVLRQAIVSIIRMCFLLSSHRDAEFSKLAPSKVCDGRGDLFQFISTTDVDLKLIRRYTGRKPVEHIARRHRHDRRRLQVSVAELIRTEAQGRSETSACTHDGNELHPVGGR